MEVFVVAVAVVALVVAETLDVAVVVDEEAAIDLGMVFGTADVEPILDLKEERAQGV